MAKTMFDNLNAIVANTLTDSIKMIDIAELHNSDDNFFEINRIEELADTILGQGGVKDNLIVRPFETGGYEIISGHRRKAAVQQLIDRGENVSHYLPCLVQEYTDENSKMLDIILMNISARQISDAELWKSYETIDKILKEKKSSGEKFGRVREKLAEMLGVSPAQVGKMQNIDKYAVSAVKEAIENGNISISTANEIAKLDEDIQEQLAETDLSNVTHKEVKKIAEKKSIKWNGVFAADIIKNIFLKWFDNDMLINPKYICHITNDQLADLIRKSKRNSSISDGGVLVVGQFDRIIVKFDEVTDYKEINNSDISEIEISWTMAARYIRVWVSEPDFYGINSNNDYDENLNDNIDDIEDGQLTIDDETGENTVDIYINSENDIDDVDIPELKKTISNDDNSDYDYEEDEDFEADEEEIENTETISDTTNMTLSDFINKHYFDLKSIFAAYLSMTNNPDEADLLEKFQKLLYQSKENENKM